jgi:2-polyprenyl-6-hydroxyphenyl methylase/3-demethylubiquinone-9 3-methyltransferase
MNTPNLKPNLKPNPRPDTEQDPNQGDERFDIETHFAFGQNWSDYARHVTQNQITAAQDGILCLLSRDDIKNKSVLDIGCGSGLHALGFLNLGARHVTAIDFDENSVQTAQYILHKFWQGPKTAFTAKTHNILETQKTLPEQQFDIVYSWGVLHHTGDMNTAITNASNLVKPGGKLLIALYKKTPLCGFWAAEKKLYTHAPKPLRTLFDYLYAALYCLGLLADRQNPVRYIKEYKTRRGMDFMTDIRDWLGGYPYESVRPQAVEAMLCAQNFTLEKSQNTETTKAFGLFGTGCAEYVLTREA